MAVKSKIAFGASSAVESAKEQGVIDAGDILLLDSDTTPKIGWITPAGNTVVIENAGADLSELEAEVDTLNESMTAVQAEVDTKADDAEVKESMSSLMEEMKTYCDTAVADAAGKIEVVEF